MKLVTGNNIRVVYETLIQLPPMDRWRLPPSKDVEFKARALKGVYGLYEADPHVITISSLKVGYLDTLVKTVAHEMVHLKRFLDQDPDWTQHDERFLELGNQISAVMGFDPKEF
jgi:predicted SprT family Zn-dependent metalloprotease